MRNKCFIISYYIRQNLQRNKSSFPSLIRNFENHDRLFPKIYLILVESVRLCEFIVLWKNGAEGCSHQNGNDDRQEQSVPPHPIPTGLDYVCFFLCNVLISSYLEKEKGRNAFCFDCLHILTCVQLIPFSFPFLFQSTQIQQSGNHSNSSSQTARKEASLLDSCPSLSHHYSSLSPCIYRYQLITRSFN